MAEPNLDSLSSELLMLVVKQLPDLRSLYNLIRASPSAYRLFGVYAAEIFETVLQSGADHEYTCNAIRIVALLRSDAVPSEINALLRPDDLPPEIHTWERFDDFYRHMTTEHRFLNPKWPEEPPLRLTSRTSAAVLGSVLVSYARNEGRMIGCLKFYLARFQPLRPSHLANEEFTWEGKFRGPNDTDHIGPWELQPEVAPFPVRDIGPPTWVEEQRVLRACWRLQIFNDLRGAVMGDRIAGWPTERLWPLQTDERAAEGLLTIGSGDRVKKYRTMEPCILGQQFQLEDELIWSVIDYVKEAEQVPGAPSPFEIQRDWPVPPRKATFWEMGFYSSAAVFFFHDVVQDNNNICLEGWYSPLQHVPWEFFRPLGFWIWCEERMLGYGLLTDPWDSPPGSEDRGFEKDAVFMAWRSVLNDEQLAEVARLNEEWRRKVLKEDWS